MQHRRLIASAAAVVLSLSISSVALATGNPNGTGQPSQTCLSAKAGSEPGHASSAPGAAFNENGGTAGAVYAGSQPQNSKNPASVSQYDVACYHVSNKP